MSILKEAEDFNDIIIGDFYDTYENLPLKTYLGYQFYNDQCKVSQKSSLRNNHYVTFHTVLRITAGAFNSSMTILLYDLMKWNLFWRMKIRWFVSKDSQ